MSWLHSKKIYSEKWDRGFENKQYQQAIAFLSSPEKYPGLRKLDINSIKLRIWQYPAFGIYSSWTLYKYNEVFGIRRIQWHGLTKAFQVYPVSPIMYGSDTIFPTKVANYLLNNLTAIKRFPFLKVPGFGTDGVVYGIKFYSLYNLEEFGWWSYPTAELSSLENWFHEAVESFLDYLPASTIESLL